MPASTNNVPVVEIARIQAERLRIPIAGTAPLIVHRFSEKAKRKMLDTQQGRKSPKEVRDPQADYEASLYRFKDDSGTEQYGFPALAFKAATVSAARFYGKDVKMTELRQFLFITGNLGDDGVPLVTLEGEPRMREDIARIGMGTTDLRYRAEFPVWRTWLDMTYVTSALSRDSVLAIIDAGGMGVGVGEWRPEKSGAFGTYSIDSERKVEVVQ